MESPTEGSPGRLAKPAEIKVMQSSGITAAARSLNRTPWMRWAAILVTVFLAYQLLLVAGGIFLRLLPIFLLLIFAALLAFMLAPLVRGLEQLGLPRTLAALAVYLGILLIVAAAITLLTDPASKQMANLVREYPVYLAQTRSALTGLDRWALDHGLPQPHLGDLVETQGISAIETRTVLASAVTIVTTVAGSLLNILLVFVMGFYLLRDGEWIRSKIRNLLPADYRAKYDFAMDALSYVVGGYVRAQVTMALIVGTLAGVGCWFLGVNYPVVIGITVGLLELIPIAGALIGSVVAIAFALLQSAHLALLVVAWFIVIHFVEAYILGPRITGVRVDLHPLLALFSMLIGVEVAGLIGALFAVPLAGLINVFVRAFYWDIRAQNPRAFGALPSQPMAGWRRAWAQLRLKKAERKVP
jgi:predicted PurR-regulated permease PerM